MRIYVHDLFLYRLIIVALVVVVVCAHPCGTAKWDVPAGQIILGHKRGGGGQQMGGEKGRRYKKSLSVRQSGLVPHFF